MNKARSVLAWCTVLSIVLGAVLAVLGITGVFTWKADLWGGKFDVGSTHVGLAFALVGMTLGIVIILRPPRKEFALKRTVEHPGLLSTPSSPLDTFAHTPDMDKLIAMIAKNSNMTEDEIKELMAKMPPSPPTYHGSSGYRETFEVKSCSRSEVRGSR